MLREYGLKTMYKTTDEDTVYSLLARRAIADPDDIIAQFLDDRRQWNDVTAGEMFAEVRSVAKGLMALGAKQGSMVVVYSATCYEWGVVDFACAAIGAVLVPVYETDSEKQAAAIVDEVGPVIAFGGDEDHVQVLERIAGNDDRLRYVFNFEADAMDALIGFGESVSDDDLDEAIGRVKADDLLTIVYTSGSTGRPKGAMLSNRNFTHIVLNGYEILPDMLYNPNRLLLFLPLAHCFARYIQYVAIGGHGVIGYVPDARHLLADLRSFKPTYLLGVPRVFEKVYNAASQKAGAGMKGRVFANAFDHFVNWSKMMNAHERPTASQKMKHSFYMGTVGASIRSALGPNLRFLACGGAPINTDLVHFFNGMDDITFIQGYGMTETAAPMVVNWQKANRPGSVGRPGPGMAVSTADDGELLVKGPNVFLGYFENPEMTADVLEPSGWLHTGDLGEIDDEGFVTITGRKKDLIITAGGKNVTPTPLENIINTCPILAHTVVVGDNKPFIGALVTLDEDMTRSWMDAQGLDMSMSLDDIANSAAAHALVQQYVDKANSNVSRAESVRKFIILPRDFSQEEGTMTASMKVVRPKVLSKYAEIIEGELYAPVPSNKPLPVSVQILDKATESARQASETMKHVQENVREKVGDYSENLSENVTHAYDIVKGRIVRGKDGEPFDTAADVSASADASVSADDSSADGAAGPEDGAAGDGVSRH
ncbi:AMP-dependent synthetase/ligase [Bifidobacterium choloepi]|uniref:Long-chain fatty acid--CoA ligase n=1 Tax=Bifidobacterium choloepi TaxID=2614131 RepID=A0A6I5NJL0_9BIFI|nr:AMP-dependent synthetase/ligase [Bifidobacterium choloepi]NEG69062.1 long-chain fatty acid--CoA ligase [Bifidobacterium choloepi]